MTALGLLLGYGADRVLGDPARFHPVAGFGRAAAVLEPRLYADSRLRGAAYTVLLVGSTVGAALIVERRSRNRPTTRTLLTAAAAWAVLGGRSLEREASAIGAMLEAGDLVGARRRLTHLVARETTGLSADEVARAVVESVAENTSDAVVAPLLWGAVAGLPGLVGYRAVNTLDAMVGYRSERYKNFGWASARLDDLVNLPAARVAGALVLVSNHQRAKDSWQVWSRDARSHPSPNAGVVEAAFAGSLGLTLGGTNIYHGAVEERAKLGDGREARVCDVTRTIFLSRRVGLAAACLATGIARYRRAEKG